MRKLNALVLAILISSLLTGPVPVFSATTGVQIEFLLSQVRNATGSLAGGRVYFYSAGTTTLKDVYLDINKTPPAAANPYTLDANGTALLYGDGTYRIVIKTAAGVTVYDRDNLKFEDLATDFVNSEYTMTLKPLNLTGDGTGTIQGYNIGAAGYTDNVRAHYVDVDHARFKINPWIDVTHPAFGATGNGTTDDSAAIQAAIDAAETAPGTKVFFPTGQYNLGTTGININGNGVILEGVSPRFVGSGAFGVEFLYSGNGTAVTFGAADVRNYRNELNNIQVRATGDAITGVGAVGVKMINQHYLTSRNAAIKDFKAGTGLYLTSAGATEFSATGQYHGLLVHQCKTGIKAVGVDSFTKDNHEIFIGGAVIGEIDGGIPGSIGIDIDQYTDGFRFYGTDVESYAIGYKIAGTSNAFFGTRSEFCTLAAQIDNTSVHTQFYGHQWAGTGRTASVVTNNGVLTNINDSYGYSGKMLVWPFVDMSEAFHVVKADGSTTIIDVITSGVPSVTISNSDFIIYTDNAFTDIGFRVDNTGNTSVKGKLRVTGLDNSTSSGSGYIYYDPTDGNRLKYVP